MRRGVVLLAFGFISLRAAQAGGSTYPVSVIPPVLRTCFAAYRFRRPQYFLPVTAVRAGSTREGQLREQEIQLLKEQARTAAVLARAQLQRQRSLVGVAWLLTIGLVAALVFYWRLRRHQVMLATAHRELRAAVAEKEVLVQEIHHRVKNNLQLVSSLLAWQGSCCRDPALQDVLAGSRARIHSMSLVHELLYRADNLAQVRLDTYLAELLQSLHDSLNTNQRPVELQAELDAVVMEARDASAFGLLVNELVTNACKHAFGPQGGGQLRITLGKGPAPGGFRLQVIDNGVGLPEGGLAGKPGCLGLQLVASLTKQLKATLTATAHCPAGTCIEVARL